MINAKENQGNGQINKNHKNKLSKKCWWWHNPIERFTFFVALFTLFLVVVGVLQFCVLRETVETSRLRDRAFINFNDPTIKEFLQYNPPEKTISVLAQNTGNVPARNVYIRYDCVRVDKSEHIRDPFSIAKFSVAPMPRFMGPKQAFNVKICDVTQTFFDEIISGKIKAFIVIKVEYLDGFGTQRTTQMSRQLHVDGSKLHSFSFAGTHNCIDDDCKE